MMIFNVKPLDWIASNCSDVKQRTYICKNIDVKIRELRVVGNSIPPKSGQMLVIKITVFQLKI